MVYKKKIIVCGWSLLISILLLCPIYQLNGGQNASIMNNPEILFEEDDVNFPESPSISSDQNLENIENIFIQKLADYSSLGYFPQVYESSLQGTYYALTILNATGKLDQVNQSRILSYILSNYNASAKCFVDLSAERYLSTKSDQNYFPLTSWLEINCYAVLSLDILNNLSCIDSQGIIDFIWSCYNPVSSGFIGQPYDSLLPDYFITSTMDNTYYAITTLDLLINWIDYSTEQTEIINYIDGLQSTNPSQRYFGGFFNDNDNGFESLDLFEPNILSSYFSLKCLDNFGMVGSINVNNFNQYLGGLYNNNSDFFNFTYSMFDLQTNLISSALGLELSDISGLSPIERQKIINFILYNRNPNELWYESTESINSDLIYTYFIIQCFNNIGEISQLNQTSKDQIFNKVADFFQYDNGYSLFSIDYTTIETIYSIVSSFEYYNRINELDLQGLYNTIESTFNYIEGPANFGFFLSCIQQNFDSYEIRSYPIEFYNYIENDFNPFKYKKGIEEIYSHKTTFQALSSLKSLFKLDDFETGHNITKFINEIIGTQFLEGGYDNFGAFLPSMGATQSTFEGQNSMVFSEYSYYAIKALELLVDYLSLGNLTDLSFDIDALYTYISSNIEGGPTTLYFNPQYTNNIEIILENTYYMIYVLNSINKYTLDSEKIKNYVIQTMNYSNIKNIYYSYKISEILDLGIDFDVNLTHSLIQNIYSDPQREFYRTIDKNLIDQEIILWICDMSKNDDVRINPQFTSPIQLGSSNNITAELCNIVLEDFGPYMSVKFESDQIGTFTFNQLPDNRFQKDIFISVNSNNYPTVWGNLTAYDGGQKKASITINFQTTYNLSVTPKIETNSNYIDIQVNLSLISGLGSQPLFDSTIFAEIHRDITYIGDLIFSSQDHIEYGLFSLDYFPSINGNYLFNVYLDDDYQNESTFLFNITFIYENGEINLSNPDSNSGIDYNDEMIISIPIILSFLVIPSCVIVLSSKYKTKSRRDFKLK